MAYARVDLLLEIVDILLKRGRLRVLFRIAGAVDLEIRTLLADVGRQIARMVEHSRRFGSFHTVASQSEHAGDFGLVEQVERLVHVVFVKVLRGQVRHGRNAVFVHRMRDACGQRAVGRFAGAVGDGDEVGVQPLQAIQRIVDGTYRAGALGREHLQREHWRMHVIPWKSCLLLPMPVTWRVWRARPWPLRRGSPGSARFRRCHGSSGRSPG